MDNRTNFQNFPPFDSQVYLLFDACLDNETRNTIGSSELLANLRDLKTSNMKYLTDWLINVHPVNLFYTISIGPNLRNVTQNILNVQPNALFFDNEQFYLDAAYSNKLDTLRNYLKEVLGYLIDDDFEHLVFSNSSAEIDRRVESFIYVEMEIARVRRFSFF